MKNQLKLLSILALLTVLFSCKTKENTVKTNEKTTKMNTIYKVLLNESHGGYKEAKQLIINDNQALNQVYMQLNMMRKPGIPIPKIDFDKNTVIALFFGTKNTGGNSYQITDITTVATDLQVKVTEEKAKIGTSVITQPSLFVLIPKTAAKSVKLILE